jgi:AcrR family transcriptional regulator
MPRSIPADRFQALLEAATAEFVEQGYRRTQVADVAARMGLSKGSVYTYVESKDALFDCVLRYADSPAPISLPETLPVPTPRPRATLELLRRRLAGEAAFPRLDAALSRDRVRDVGRELHEILSELYDVLARHRTAIKLLDRCALDHPELAELWSGGGREGLLAQLSRYLDDRARRGRLRRHGEPIVVARMLLETLVFWAVHRHWDKAPQKLDEESSRKAVVFFLVAGLVHGEA